MARKTKARPPRPGFNQYGFKIKKPSSHTEASSITKKRKQAPPATVTASSASERSKRTSEQDIAKPVTKRKDPPRTTEQRSHLVPKLPKLLDARSVTKQSKTSFLDMC